MTTRTKQTIGGTAAAIGIGTLLWLAPSGTPEPIFGPPPLPGYQGDCSRDPGMVGHFDGCEGPAGCHKFIDWGGDRDCDWGDLRDFAKFQTLFGGVSVVPKDGTMLDWAWGDINGVDGVDLKDWQRLDFSWAR